MKIKFVSGQSLVELMLAIGISAIMLPALLTGFLASREGKAQQIQRTEASSHLRQIEEAVRSVRESGWTAFAIDGTFHPAASGSAWGLASGSQTVNGYTKAVVISGVYRDSSGTIVASGGTLDPSTKKVVTQVSWSTPIPYTLSSTSYLTRYLDNLTDVDTTQANFDQGTKTGVATTNESGGEVVLSGGGHGDWCLPALNLTQLNLPKSGVANALSAIPAVAPSTPGMAFTGTGDNASGISFASVSITDGYPPDATSSATFDGYKTNDIFGTSNNAYLATDNNSKEVVIIDLLHTSNKKYLEAGAFNAPGNGNGDAVSVSGSTGFMTAGDKFYAFNAGTGTRIGGSGNLVTLAGTGKRMKIVGNYAYIAINSASTQLQIIDISNPSGLSQSSIIGWANSVNDKVATAIHVNDTGTLAYLTTLNSASNPELFVLDVTTKTGNHTPVASANLGTMSPKGVVAVTNNKVIAVGTGGTEYQVFTFSGNSLSTCGSGLDVDIGINGIAAVTQPSGFVYSYIITGDTSSEFKIIEGGPNGSVSTNGVFESRTFSTSYLTAFNHLSYSANLPSGTSITMQTAVADSIAGSCSGVSFSYVDVDASGVIPFDSPISGYQNPGRCLRYKAFLSSTDPSSSPTLYDVTINYSP